MESWLTIAYVYPALSVLCGLTILWHISRCPQQMAIMNVVWPVTALYAGPLALWAYFAFGRRRWTNKDHRNQPVQPPFWQSVLKGTLHCGSGCTLGDLLSAGLVLVVPVSILGSKTAGDWLIEYIAAFLIGIIFQYYAIKPMRQLSVRKAVLASLKADALSLTCWQIGMYGWMAISSYIIFHRRLTPDEPVFWLMMQIGMLGGFITAYPVNWWLIRRGIKEAM